MGRDRAIVLRAGEGRSVALGQGLELCFKADEPETGGRYSINVVTVAPEDPGTTPHVHREHDEIFFVIDGTPSFEIEGNIDEAPPGTFVLVPSGHSHRWWNPQPTPAVVLNIHTPGFGFESFIRELADLSEAGTATPEAMLDRAARHDIHFDTAVLDDRYGDRT